VDSRSRTNRNWSSPVPTSSDPCLLYLVHSPVLGTHSCTWYTLLYLVHTPVLGTHSYTWCTLLYLVHSPILGTHSCTWYTLLYLVHTPVLGTQSYTWYTVPYLVPICSVLCICLTFQDLCIHHCEGQDGASSDTSH
jgi:hypothetical protein